MTKSPEVFKIAASLFKPQRPLESPLDVCAPKDPKAEQVKGPYYRIKRLFRDELTVKTLRLR